MTSATSWRRRAKFWHKMLYAEDKVASLELRRNEWVFWGGAVILCLLFLGTDAWWGSEASFAEAVREMVLGSRFWQPTLNGVECNGLPLPLLWEGVLCGKLSGVSEWSLRFVVSLNALFFLAGTMVLAKSFFTRRIALLAGVLMMGSCGFLYTARLFLGVIPAAACGIWAVVLLARGRGRGYVVRVFAAGVLLLFAMFFGTFYAVFPPLIAGLTLRCFETEKTGKGAIAGWILICVALSAAAFGLRHYGVLPPAYPDFSGNFGNDFLRAAGFDALRVFFPWSGWLIVAVIRYLFVFGKSEKNVRAFTVAAIAIWLVLLIPAMENWRQMIYLLPYLAILTSAMLSEERNLSRAEKMIDVLVRYFVMISGAVAVASIVVIPIWKILFKVEVSGYILWSVPVAGLIAQGFLLCDRRAAGSFALPGRCGGVVLAAVTLTAAAFCIIRPNFAALRSGRSFIVKSLQPQLKNLPKGTIMYYGGAPSAFLLYYAEADAPFVVAEKADRKRKLREFLAGHGERFVALVADANAAMNAEIAEVARDFELPWKTPMAAETLPDGDSAGYRLMLFYGNAAKKTEEKPTNSEEKP